MLKVRNLGKKSFDEVTAKLHSLGLDFAEEEDSYEIITDPEAFSTVFEALEEAKIVTVSAEVTMIPQTWGTLTDEGDIKNMNKILDLLDEDDDVQQVYHNWDE